MQQANTNFAFVLAISTAIVFSFFIWQNIFETFELSSYLARHTTNNCVCSYDIIMLVVIIPITQRAVQKVCLLTPETKSHSLTCNAFDTG